MNLRPTESLSQRVPESAEPESYLKTEGEPAAETGSGWTTVHSDLQNGQAGEGSPEGLIYFTLVVQPEKND
jgi:hypothetical protein